MRVPFATLTIAVSAGLTSLVFAQEPVPAVKQELAQPGIPRPIGAGPTARLVPRDEEIEVTLTHPMPIEGGPADCQVDMSERYCRADKQPVTRFTVVHQRVLGNRSSVGKVAIDKGCVTAEVKLGTDKAAGVNQCVAGEPQVRMRLVLSATPL